MEVAWHFSIVTYFMKGICRLCNKEQELRGSHIIPSFIFKWLKDSSGTDFIRYGRHPSLRVQDGIKSYLLCDGCEGLFNGWETEFANSIFHPCNEGKITSLSYRDWMLKFAVSVSWRVLNFIIDDKGLSGFPEALKEKVDDALARWRAFLMDEAPHPAQFEQHMFLLSSVESFSIKGVPSNINRYFLRTIDTDLVFGGDKVAYVYSKMCPIVLVGFVEMPHPERWKGTKIHVKKGIFGTRHYSLPSKFGEYILDRAKEAQKLERSISAKQKKKIKETYFKDKERGIKSESFKAMAADVELFGEDAVFEEEE